MAARKQRSLGARRAAARRFLDARRGRPSLRRNASSTRVEAPNLPGLGLPPEDPDANATVLAWALDRAARADLAALVTLERLAAEASPRVLAAC